jgi:hypothetical protein
VPRPTIGLAEKPLNDQIKPGEEGTPVILEGVQLEGVAAERQQPEALGEQVSAAGADAVLQHEGIKKKRGRPPKIKREVPAASAPAGDVLNVESFEYCM